MHLEESFLGALGCFYLGTMGCFSEPFVLFSPAWAFLDAVWERGVGPGECGCRRLIRAWCSATALVVVLSRGHSCKNNLSYSGMTLLKSCFRLLRDYSAACAVLGNLGYSGRTLLDVQWKGCSGQLWGPILGYSGTNLGATLGPLW